ncbi:DUF3027 domain-containing protein [Gardnerella sp. KA00225]|uniref:DUF3027 domain-containing protein n=1 Tax=Gardnerella vaginalis TaxID=2702 RepID=A0A2K1SWG6_GARVA|nr:DUF3027 domain-containing protein [Gardnerella vaginalis]
MSVDVLNPQDLAYKNAVETSERDDAVGDFVTAIDLGDNVTDYRFECTMRGYEGWQWSVTLYHDEEAERWTINESTLVPTEDSLLPPVWIPWKDRLKPSDLSVTDSIGTEENDSRLENGVSEVEDKSELEDKSENSDSEASENNVTSENTDAADANANEANEASKANEAAKSSEESEESEESKESEESESSESYESNEDFEDAVEAFHLSRRKVMTAEAIAQTAKRWYSGQHGPKSLSTRIAEGNACSTCGFMIPLAGALGNMFGVCANAWSPDDGKVVSLDHGCGEHSDIEPPEPSQIWIQSEPAYDDYHIDVIEQSPREERADVELIEEAIEDSKENKRKKRKTSSKR